jgi:hypothetical protein
MMGDDTDGMPVFNVFTRSKKAQASQNSQSSHLTPASSPPSFGSRTERPGVITGRLAGVVSVRVAQGGCAFQESGGGVAGQFALPEGPVQNHPRQGHGQVYL